MKPTFDKNRPVSWSFISSFEYDKERWYETYVLGKRQSSKEMSFGSVIDKKLQLDPKFMPHVPRYDLMQHKMKVMFDGIPLVGLPDGLDISKKLLADYKTGKTPWTRKKADETRQFTMYLLLVYISYKIRPEVFRCFIHWLPTQENGDFSISLINEKDIKTFETKRTMRDLLEFGVRIKRVYKEAEEYCQAHA